MSTCTVNGRTRGVPETLKTWGDLLVWLERHEAGERPIVSAVRFQGVDEPSFRAASVQGLRLTAISPIDIDLATARELVISAAATVNAGLEPLTLAAQVTAEAFRRHDLGPAYQTLGEFVGTFRALAQLTTAIDGLVTETLFDADARAFLAQLEERFEELIGAAANEDWISVADVLEYEIAEMVADWSALLRDIDRRSAVRRVS